MKESYKPYVHAVIAIIALFFYDRGGQAFIALMAPYVIYMVIKKDANFLPALMIHCSSGTSIQYAIFISFMLVCIIDAGKILSNKKLRPLFIMLLGVLPIYIVLIVQKMNYDSFTWQAAFNYTCCYLSFWAFLYCVLLSNTISSRILSTIIVSIVVLYLFGNVLNFINISRLSSIFMLLSLVYGFFIILKTKYFVVGFVIMVLGVPAFLFGEHGTFTSLISVIYAISVIILWDRRKRFISKTMGWIPFIVIFIIIFYGIINYRTVDLGNYSDSMDFSSWSGFWSRLRFKLYGDRAVFWDAGWDQLMYYTPWFPKHNMPDIIVYDLEGRIAEVEFGAHNSPLQLLRIFGFIMGGVLIVCYMIMTILSSDYFKLFNSNRWEVPLFAISITNTIVVFLTGTLSMLPEFALFSFGLMGVAYGKYINQGMRHENTFS